MRGQLITSAVFLLTFAALAGCGSGDTGDATPGSLSLPLGATSSSGRAFVLCEGTFAVTSPGYDTEVLAEEHVDEQSVALVLQPSEYEVLLRPGWTLCELQEGDLEPVEARLLSAATQSFEIEANETTFVYYRFEVDGEPVAFGGQLVLGIDVVETSSGMGGSSGAGGSGTAGSSTIHAACANAQPLLVSAPSVELGSTTHSPANAVGRCGGSGPENVYTFELEEPSRVDFLMIGYDTVLYLRRECEVESSELACNDDAQDASAHATATLEPGRYYLFADSYEEGGDYELQYSVTANPCVPDACPEAQTCLPSPDWLSFSCLCGEGQLSFEEGCVDDPCDPNPCATLEHQSLCVADLPSEHTCECSPGYVDDGQAGCAEDPNANDWTVMVFLNADNDLSSFGYDDVNEMAEVGSSDEVDIVSLFDTYDEGASIIHISQGGYDWVESWGEVDMGDASTLADFGAWAATHYPARHYALVMWDHGDGWKTSNKANSTVSRGFSSDDHGGTGLIEISNGEYAGALAAITSTIGAKLDIVGFDACFMGMWEVAEASAPYANYLVASSEVEPEGGWAYDTTLALLASRPTATPVELGTHIVNTYHEADEANATMAVTDLSGLSAAEDALTEFANELMVNPNLFRAIDRVRGQSQAFNLGQHRDLIDFASRIAAMREAPEELVAAALNLAAVLGEVIVDSRAQSGYPGSHGLAIYFPARGVQMDPAYSDSGAIWSENATWDEFLQAFTSI
jgi:hypothetical protein